MKKFWIIALMVLLCGNAWAQNRVTGKVTSSQDGSPIPFASVVVKGTMTGVASNENGAYVLDNVPSNAVLVFSSIGFNDLEVSVAGRAVIDAALSPNAESLEETIVVAYGTALQIMSFPAGRGKEERERKRTGGRLRKLER